MAFCRSFCGFQCGLASWISLKSIIIWLLGFGGSSSDIVEVLFLIIIKKYNFEFKAETPGQVSTRSAPRKIFLEPQYTYPLSVGLGLRIDLELVQKILSLPSNRNLHLTQKSREKNNLLSRF